MSPSSVAFVVGTGAGVILWFSCCAVACFLLSRNCFSEDLFRYFSFVALPIVVDAKSSVALLQHVNVRSVCSDACMGFHVRVFSL